MFSLKNKPGLAKSSKELLDIISSHDRHDGSNRSGDGSGGVGSAVSKAAGGANNDWMSIRSGFGLGICCGSRPAAVLNVMSAVVDDEIVAAQPRSTRLSPLGAVWGVGSGVGKTWAEPPPPPAMPKLWVPLPPCYRRSAASFSCVWRISFASGPCNVSHCAA